MDTANTNDYSEDLFSDDIFDIDFLDSDPDEPLWDKLIQQIIDGNVIPIIGPELLTVGQTDIHHFIVNGIGKRHGIKKPINSFSELIYTPEFNAQWPNRDKIYNLVNDVFVKTIFPATPLLKRFLSIRQFPFVITTSFTPIVEQAMRDIWKDELRVMCFCNNTKVNDDIKTGADLRKPTVYYMFGKVCKDVQRYVLTDTDMLAFVSSWLSDNRPKVLCNELKDKYLLMLGNNYSNWLFRFIWYSMRNPNLGRGMLAYDTLDEQLINFLERAETFTKQNTTDVIEQIINRLDEKLAENEKIKFNKPEDNTDVFISYSRSDSHIAEQLYEALTRQGKRVWFDKNNLTEGGNFMDEIKKAIRTAKYFIPIFTQNVAREKGEPHVYRNEWDHAIEVAISMGRTYIIPMAENGFDFYNAAIPEKIQQHNAIIFNKEEGIDVVAEKIIHKMNQD